jgi:hypothetical protein
VDEVGADDFADPDWEGGVETTRGEVLLETRKGDRSVGARVAEKGQRAKEALRQSEEGS